MTQSTTQATPNGAKRTKVAILGGGVGAMVAAFELTRPELNGRFEVTVYQPGWRLGGKGASGRNMTDGEGRRIEEHGLHVWFGFYENAFGVMRDAYQELVERGLASNDRFKTVWDAFKGCDKTVVFDRQGAEWRSFGVSAPPRAGKPGDGAPLPSVWDIAAELSSRLQRRWRLVHWLAFWRLAPRGRHWRAPGRQRGVEPTWFDDLQSELGMSFKRRHYRWGKHLPMLAEAVARQPDRPQPVTSPAPSDPLDQFAQLICAFRNFVWDYVAKDQIIDDPALRFFFTTLDAWACGAHGVVHDRILERGFDAINGLDLCQWLEDNGAKTVTVGATPGERSPMLRAIYDLAFAYPDGKIDDAMAAAGTAVSDFLRLMFAHSGSLLYKMQAGMGDAVFAPLYRVLDARGVAFKFFTAVTDLGLSKDGKSVETIEVVPQVEVAGDKYDPVFELGGVWCWPNEPDWTKLVDGSKVEQEVRDKFGDPSDAFELHSNPFDATPTQLVRGTDFDQVVLGISVGALPAICSTLTVSNPRFKQMLDDSVTTPTQAFQLWLRKSTRRLGWRYGLNSIAGCYVEPMDTFCDMSQLIPRETWSPGQHVRSIAYFCGVLETRAGESQAAATERVKEGAREFMDNDMGPLWPKAVDSAGRLRPELLVDGVDGQYYRANISGSELYVLSPPGKIHSRLPSDASGFDNLVLAGDWTRNGIDAGCVESAALSGRQAARKLTGASNRLPGENRKWLKKQRTDEVAEPKYVEYGALETAPGPFRCEGAKFRGFILEADASKLEELFHRVLTHPTPGPTEYHSLGNQVVLMIGRIEKICSVIPEWASRGSAPEWQASIAIPVVAGRRGPGGVFIPERLLTATPYMLVDNPLSLCGGREIFGYPKALGRFPEPPPPDWWNNKLTVCGFGGEFGPDEVVSWCELITVEPQAQAPNDAGQPAEEWTKAEHFVRHHLRAAGHEGGNAPLRLGDFTVPWEVLEPSVGGSSDSVFLKQFRDNDEPDRGCFRQVITAPVQVTKLTGAPSNQSWTVTIKKLDSHPIVTELGLVTQTTQSSFMLEMDFILGAVESPPDPARPPDPALPVGGVMGTPSTSRHPLRRHLDSADVKLSPLAGVAATGAAETRTAIKQAWERYRAEHRR
jgi:uncharacterized protein with NAD-binding domain and iron-sulfur cluster